jgi:hypothetical protein
MTVVLNKRPTKPDPVRHEVAVDTGLLDRVLVLVRAIITNDRATEGEFHYLKQFEYRLVDEDTVALIPLPKMEALLFVTDHTVRLLGLLDKPDAAAALRVDFDELERVKRAHVAQMCKNCGGLGYTRSDTQVRLETARGWGMVRPYIACPPCSGSGMFPPVDWQQVTIPD